jgi:hypothetical protein
MFLAPVIGGGLALLCLWAGFRAGRRRRLVENIPTSKTTGVFIGLVELHGTAEAGRPLTSFLAEQRCVHYEWSVEEHWSRTVTETYTDSDGKQRTRTRHESGWKTVANGGEAIPFYLRDDCGVVLVRPEGAQVEPASMFDQTCGRWEPLYYAKGPPFAVADSDHRRRFRERGIPLHAPLYVMGQARERADVVAPEIAADKQAPMFLISTRTEAQVRSGLRWAQWGWAVVGLIPAVGGAWFAARGAAFAPGREWLLPLLAGLAYLGFGGAVWVWMVFNSLVDLRNRVRQAWSQVDVQLKRRHDLIPNLVEVVRGYRDHEAGLQTELAELRRQLAATPPGRPGPDYRAVNQTVFAIAERYPDLKANEVFAGLQKNLVDTEQRIALARGYFNEIATHYNTRLEIVPERFVAGLARLTPETLMAANEFERAPVPVDLAA